MVERALEFLIVEDSPQAVTTLTRILKNLGHGVAGTVGTGAEALAFYDEYLPDGVIMDIFLPELDGIEATRRIVEAHPDATIIIATSHGQEQKVLAALKAGAKGYVLKPVREGRLEKMIGEVFGERARSETATETPPEPSS